MNRLMIASALMFASTPLAAQTPVDQPPVASARAQGVLRLKSANDFNTTVERIKADVAAKGVMLFNVIDQQALGEKAGIKLRRSTLILFGNPPLGTQFLTANPVAGLDWPYGCWSAKMSTAPCGFRGTTLAGSPSATRSPTGRPSLKWPRWCQVRLQRLAPRAEPHPSVTSPPCPAPWLSFGDRANAVAGNAVGQGG